MSKVRIKPNKTGMALVMTLMILSVAMLTGLFMNSIIVGEVRISLNTVNVVNSYYAAESGVERALYFLTADQVAGNLDHYEYLGRPGNSYDLGNSTYSYATTSLRAQDFSVVNVSNTNPAHVSILDPSGDIGGINWPWNGVTSVRADIKWSIDNCFPRYASDRIEITMYSFASHFVSPDVSKLVSVCDCESGETSDSCRSIRLSDISASRYYNFVFRPLDSDASRLNFSLSGDQPILSEALIQVDGHHKSSEYRLQARTSALNPASDIFSFVIFSEEEIIKGQP